MPRVFCLFGIFKVVFDIVPELIRLKSNFTKEKSAERSDEVKSNDDDRRNQNNRNPNTNRQPIEHFSVFHTEICVSCQNQQKSERGEMRNISTIKSSFGEGWLCF